MRVILWLMACTFSVVAGADTQIQNAITSIRPGSTLQFDSLRIYKKQSPPVKADSVFKCSGETCGWEYSYRNDSSITVNYETYYTTVLENKFDFIAPQNKEYKIVPITKNMTVLSGDTLTKPGTGKSIIFRCSTSAIVKETSQLENCELQAFRIALSGDTAYDSIPAELNFPSSSIFDSGSVFDSIKTRLYGRWIFIADSWEYSGTKKTVWAPNNDIGVDALLFEKDSVSALYRNSVSQKTAFKTFGYNFKPAFVAPWSQAWYPDFLVSDCLLFLNDINNGARYAYSAYFYKEGCKDVFSENTVSLSSGPRKPHSGIKLGKLPIFLDLLGRKGKKFW